MKFISLLSSGALVLISVFFAATPITSCTKTETIRDTVTIPCNCNEEALKKGLVAYYNFNNGNLNDSSGKGNHIVFNNAVKTADRLGRANNAYLFDGTSSYMRITNSASLNPTEEITLAAIIKPTDWYNGQCLQNQVLGKVETSDYSDGIYWLRYTHESADCSTTSDIENQRFFCTYGNNTSNSAPGVLASTHRLTKNNWYKVVYTYKAGKSNLYVNGTLVDEVAKSGSFTANNFDLFIGKSNSSQYPFWFKGVIDEVRIYDRALCAEEVDILNKLTN